MHIRHVILDKKLFGWGRQPWACHKCPAHGCSSYEGIYSVALCGMNIGSLCAPGIQVEKVSHIKSLIS